MNNRTLTVLLVVSLFAAGCIQRPVGAPMTSATETVSSVQTPDLAAQTSTPSVQITMPQGQVEVLAWIDTHTHPSTSIVSIDKAGGSRKKFVYCVTPECLESMISIMDEVGTSYAMLMSPPASAGHGNSQFEADLASAARENPERFFYVGGGAVLNPLVHQAVKAGRVTDTTRAEFEAAAQAILADGAVGFGEIAILHLSLSASHPFEEAPANHELLLLLADLAAQNDVPIDIHMDPVLQDMQTPDEIIKRSLQNPTTLQGNIELFEALLSHNPATRIIWAHTADTTGDLSAELLRDLLVKHTNLYLSLRLAPARRQATDGKDNILDSAGNIQTEWQRLIQDYPERFIIGSDIFWGERDAVPSQTLATSFLAQLPHDIAERIACLNVATIYQLDVTCP